MKTSILKLHIKLIFTALGILLLTNCKQHNKTLESQTQNINEGLVLEINKMYELDQYVSGIPQGNYQDDWQGWFKYRDSVSRQHKLKLENILNTYGFPGYDLVGEEASHHYWNMAQHCDFDVVFQQNVLTALKLEVKKNNAKASHMGFLTDRINVNLEKPQIYGTQLDYDMSKCRALPKGGLVDSIHVNTRRAKLKMEPYSDYLNKMLKEHFNVNKKYYIELGITEPNYH